MTRAETKVQRSLARYGADRWGKEFLSVNDSGHLLFSMGDMPAVDLQALVLRIQKAGLSTPLVLRFTDVIADRMKRLRDAFFAACEATNYRGGFTGIYPIKVNSRSPILEAIVEVRARLGFGLEAGSKPELLLISAQQPVDGLPLLCNGFKDREFMRMAFHAAEIGHEVVIVLESLRELNRFLEVEEERQWHSRPSLGMRAKLYSKGAGKWETSGGELSKFGLTTVEMLEVIRRLERVGSVDRLTLLHFHIGSQITKIRPIKMAVREGAQLWGHLRSRVPTLRYLDLGGGIGIDYDGSHSSSSCSSNYSVEEYANQVVFEISEVCNEHGFIHPQILTESGRALVAHHAVTITDLRQVQGQVLPVPEVSKEEHRIISELRSTLASVAENNYEEYFHDAVDFRDEALQLFSRGYLSLDDRAAAEALFHRIRLRCQEIDDQVPSGSAELTGYLRQARVKYLANFSIFQSIPDFWSINQIFPAAPLRGHDGEPNYPVQIVDITCDSDGRVDAFAHPDGNLTELPLHRAAHEESPSEGYLAFFLTGAYQDALGNLHNMFGRCHEIILRRHRESDPKDGDDALFPDDDFHVSARPGMSNSQVLAQMGYDEDTMRASIVARSTEQATSLGAEWALTALAGYPYLQR